MADDKDKADIESTTAELQKRIADAFGIFDHESNKTVDVRYSRFCVKIFVFFLVAEEMACQ